MSVTINGEFTLDESAGLQTGAIGTSDPGGDNNDNDVLLSAMQSQAPAFYTRLFGSVADGGLGLSTAFPTSVGVGKSADNFITVTSIGTVVSLGFTQADGTALPVLGGASTVDSGLVAVTGGTINLLADSSSHGNRLVLGKDADGIAYAMFMQPTGTGLSTARVWTVELEPLRHDDTTNFDDPDALQGVSVSAGISTTFDFNTLPSGQNLFGLIGDPQTGLIIIGKDPDLAADGKYTNISDTINTSKGGGGTTIGVDNQMFDPGDGAYFTFVHDPKDSIVGVELDANEADDANEIEYVDPLEVTSGFLNVVQSQGNAGRKMRLSAFDLAGAPQKRDFVNKIEGPVGADKTPVNITKVWQNGNLVFSGSATSVEIANINAGDKIEWETATGHDTMLVEGVTGKFDIGGFGTTQGTSESVPLTGVRFEDDGLTLEGVAGGISLTVDESNLGVNHTLPVTSLPEFVATFGKDGAGNTPQVSYALTTTGGASGLVDTLTGQSVVLSLVGGVVQGRTATSDELVFTVSLDSNNSITLDQLRAVVHPDTNNHNDSVSVGDKILVVGTATATDPDGDSITRNAGADVSLFFVDDGVSITGEIDGAPELGTDESGLPDNDSGDFEPQFDAVFGADGEAASEPVGYALSTPGGASGLTDTASGQSVVLSLNASGEVEGKTASSGLLVFKVSVDGDGVVTLTQLRAVSHPDADDHNDSVTLANANLVVLTATATDGDGDHDEASLDIGQQLNFADDGPSIGNIDNGIVNFAEDSSVTNTLNGVLGADGTPSNGAPYTIVDTDGDDQGTDPDGFTPSLTVNGVTVVGVLSANKQVVSYFDDKSGNGTFGDAGDTEYYRLTLNQSGAGEYKFEVFVNPPPAFLEFNFNALPSGQNLFGMVGDLTNGLIVHGKNMAFDPVTGELTNASNTVNTSQGGGPTTIGINNQMFDPDDGAYFTFVKNPDPRYLAGVDGGLNQGEADDADFMLYDGGTLEVSSAFVKIAQIQGNSPATMRITARNITGSPQGRALPGNGPTVPITAIRVFNAAGQLVNNPQVTIDANGVATVGGLGANFKVEWDTNGLHDQALIEGVAGKFDIGGFGAVQVAPTPDQVLHFVAKVTDGDGDSATDDFFIGIDGTGPHDDNNVVFPSSSSASLFGSEPIGSDSEEDALAALLA